MLADERLRVKIGAFAIIEEIKETNPESLIKIIPEVTKLLNSVEKNIRGDAAYALEIIGSLEAKPALIKALQKEEDPQVKEFIEDAIRSLK